MTNQTIDSFAHAFADLGNRIDRALGVLESMPYHPRRAAKIDGLEKARDIYDEIATAHPVPAAPAWREFTEQVFMAYLRASGSRVPEIHDAATGLSLALGYQRGYAPEVDAPTLALMLTHEGALS